MKQIYLLFCFEGYGKFELCYFFLYESSRYCLLVGHISNISNMLKNYTMSNKKITIGKNNYMIKNG